MRFSSSCFEQLLTFWLYLCCIVNINVSKNFNLLTHNDDKFPSILEKFCGVITARFLIKVCLIIFHHIWVHFSSNIPIIIRDSESSPLGRSQALSDKAQLWSKLEVSFLLVEHGARIYENNIHGVRPVDLDPVSYSHSTKDILV